MVSLGILASLRSKASKVCFLARAAIKRLALTRDLHKSFSQKPKEPSGSVSSGVSFLGWWIFVLFFPCHPSVDSNFWCLKRLWCYWAKIICILAACLNLIISLKIFLNTVTFRNTESGTLAEIFRERAEYITQ